jgi:hypothetical protein
VVRVRYGEAVMDIFEHIALDLDPRKRAVGTSIGRQPPGDHAKLTPRVRESTSLGRHRRGRIVRGV